MAKKKPSPLEAHVSHWLRLISNQISSGLARRLAEGEVTAAEWVVLRELYDHDGLASSDLAKRLGLTAGAITKLVDRLDPKGLVMRVESEGDARFTMLVLTEAGRNLVPGLAALADQNESDFFGHLKASDRQAIIATLKDVAARRGLKPHPVD